MTSQDNQQYITVELFNSKMETLITQIQLGNERLRNELRSEIQAVDTNVKINSTKIEMLGHYMYWGFAAMTLIITAVAFIVPYLVSAHKEKKQNEKSTSHLLTEDNVRQLINEVLQKRSANTIGK